MVTVVSASNNSTKTTTAICSSGKRVFWGGCVISASGNETQVTVTGAYPTANDAWT